MWQNDILPGYQYFPVSFQRVIPYLLASLVYHFHNGDLLRIFPSDHLLFRQILFTQPTILNSLKEKVILVHGYCPDTHMSAQGVPTNIVIQRELREFKVDYQRQKEQDGIMFRND